MPILEKRRTFFKETMHFHYITYMATPQHKNRGHEIYNFGRPLPGHQNFILTLSVLCLGVESNIFKEKCHFEIHNMTTHLHKKS